MTAGSINRRAAGLLRLVIPLAALIVVAGLAGPALRGAVALNSVALGLPAMTPASGAPAARRVAEGFLQLDAGQAAGAASAVRILIAAGVRSPDDPELAVAVQQARQLPAPADLYGLATYAYRRGAPAVAQGLYRAYLEVFPASRQGWIALGDAYTGRVREPWGYDPPASGGKPDWDAAIDAYTHALDLGSSADGYYALALAEYAGKQSPTAAMAALDRAIALTTDPLDGYQWCFMRGDWLLAQGRTAEALQAYEEAARWGYPLSPYWHQHYGQALLKAGRGEEAKAELRTAGQGFSAQGNSDLARQSYQEILKVDPADAGARRALEDLAGRTPKGGN